MNWMIELFSDDDPFVLKIETSLEGILVDITVDDKSVITFETKRSYHGITFANREQALDYFERVCEMLRRPAE